MGEQVADGHAVATGASPPCDVPTNRIVERHRASFDLLHHQRCGGHHLREGGEIEHGVLARGLRVGVKRQATEGFAPERFQ
jgi:hypothetical protein